MAMYEYQCARCGRFDIRLPIGTAPERHRCPDCSAPARRAFTAPMLGRGSSPLTRMWERAEKSQDEPEVVTRVPPPERGPHARTRRLGAIPSLGGAAHHH